MRALILTAIFFIQLTVVQASRLIDSVSALSDSSIVLNQPDSITKKVVLLLYEAHELSAKKPAEALKNYRKALTINKVKDLQWEAGIRLEMGKLLYRLKSADAIPQLLKADALYKRKADIPGRTDAITEIARIQEKKGLFTQALKTYNELFSIQSKAHEALLAGNTATYLSNLFLKKQNLPEALKYAELAKTQYYKFCVKDSLGSTYYRIAFIKRKQKSPKQAEHYILNEALSYYRSSDDQQGRLKSFEFLGSLYLDQKRFSEAKWFYLQANNQARIMDDVPATINSLINLGVTKILIGDITLAKQDIDEADQIAKTDSSYAPIMKKAKIRYASLFKKLTAPVIASNVSGKTNTATKLKSKTPVKKSKANAKPVATTSSEEEKHDETELVVTENR